MPDRIGVSMIKPLDTYLKHKILLAVCDALSLILAFFLSYTLRNYFFLHRGGVYEPTLPHFLFLAGLIAMIFLYFRHNYLYRELAFRPSVEHLEILTRSWLSFVVVFIVIDFFLKVQLFTEHRITVMFFGVLGWFGLFVSRFVLVPRIAEHYFYKQETPDNVIIVGSGPDARRAAERLDESYIRKVKVVGFVDDVDSPPGGFADGLPLLGSLKSVADLVRQHNVSEVFIHLSAGQEDRLSDVFSRLQSLDVRIRVALSHFGVLKDKVPDLPEVEQNVVYLNKSTFAGAEATLKRMFDYVGSLLGLIVLSPFFLAVGLLIKVDSAGPVFFRQKRSGKGEKEFEVFKFRTMLKNTETFHREAIKSLVEGDADYFKEQTGKSGFFKATDDSNVTRVGRWLRKSSLDELPQLINVLRGEMSFVGPRPLPLYEVKLLKPWQHYRHTMKPGITGFWQVFGRSVVSHEDTMLMDIFYITNWSLALDIRILVRTFFVVLTGKGAL
jgi:exopolysaccharide biosynthesis polyprenyl glycosylphosphotransferase